MTVAYEVNFDGLIGSTHNYAGLSYGNIASTKNKLAVSNPREAALQGLAKMKYLADLGIKQAVLPPQQRPHMPTLRRLGFTGTDAEIIAKAHREDATLLAACYSASAMWAANAATVSPSADASDGRVHFTAANLASHFHRSLEAEATSDVLRQIFRDERSFAHHPPLPASMAFSDEGAANHTRLCRNYGESGIEIFTYGQTFGDATTFGPAKYPARQTLQSSSVIARLHELDPSRTILVRQNPAAIDAGAFHNDVVAVGNRNVLLYHEHAFADSRAAIDAIRRAFEKTCGGELHLFEVSEDQIPLRAAIESYFFNSQLVTLPDGRMSLIAPTECFDNPHVHRFLSTLDGGGLIASVHYVDVRQSMRNGGGPACLRLRVVLTPEQLAQAHPGVFLTDQLFEKLSDCICRRYRDYLAPDDLADPKLLDESRAAVDEIMSIVGLPQM